MEGFPPCGDFKTFTNSFVRSVLCVGSFSPIFIFFFSLACSVKFSSAGGGGIKRKLEGELAPPYVVGAI